MALYTLSGWQDDQFVAQAKQELESEDPQVRLCAQVYLDAVVKMKSSPK